MENRKNLILEYQLDFKKLAKPTKKSVTVTNVPELLQKPSVEEQLAAIRDRINQLAMFVGVPHKVPFDGIMTLYPARIDGRREASEHAVSYTVNLTPFRGMFSAVRFKAMSPLGKENDIVRGVIIDDEGNVECATTNLCERNNPWTRMQLSEKSNYLIATVPAENGKPLWIPDFVEFLPQGLAQDVADAVEELNDDFWNYNGMKS